MIPTRPIRIKNFINGQWREEKGGNALPLYNPSTGEEIGSLPLSGEDAAQAAIAAAHDAYFSWKNRSVANRIGFVHAIRARMERDCEKLAVHIAYDQGKHISEARGEVRRVIELAEMACSIPALIQGDTLDQVGANISCKIVKQSLGVFGGVAPFNFPALVFGWFIPFAIAAGNTFIFKPSSKSPLFMQGMCEIFQEIDLPPGVVNVVHGGRGIPGSWYEDARVAGVCLVGSTPTAKKMAAACANGAKRSMLLGGAKNLLLVMEDADIDLFIDNFLNSCYGSAGQRCLAGSIVAVVPGLYEAVLERMIAASGTVRIGDAMDPDVYMGPLISPEAVENVKRYMDIALAHGKGCELVLDGRNPALPARNKNGFFVGPTIIKDVTPCNPLFSTEVFGPLVAVTRVADMNEALALIRASEFGNGACVFTQNQHYAETFSREADVGMVGVNIGVCAPHPYAPFGGIKGSLLGTNKVQGKCGIDFFTQDKVVTIRTKSPRGDEAVQQLSGAAVRSCVAT
ncbi:MAG: aldehyde dehydrogenase family protein [Desulfovibrio sp.]|jgi:malonate-semialdehyde dehydrogenase (acetylating)/methylmalonate-semialdehyde dehydrogenase|nr:aldehyde dehydrogenase family protein [Desulfovibrio sp.]